jgi:hypothetical protein
VTATNITNIFITITTKLNKESKNQNSKLKTNEDFEEKI